MAQKTSAWAARALGWLAAAALALAVAGCGDGSSLTAPTAAPAGLASGYMPQGLKFSWTATAGAA